MAKRNVYHVVPEGMNWQVKFEGRVQGTYILKSQAIESGRLKAKANTPSQLVVHRSDGTIEVEWTYGEDPYPPEG